MGSPLVQALLTGVALALPSWWLFNWLLQQATRVPGPYGLPGLGTLLDLQAKSWHGQHIECMRRYGRVFRVRHGSTPHVVVASAEPAKQVLNKCSFRFMFPSPLPRRVSQLYQDGLLFANTQYHRQLKSVWLPAFQPSALPLYEPIMAQCALKLVKVLELAAEPLPGGAPRYVDVWQLISYMTLEVVGEAGFGISLDSLSLYQQVLAGGTPPKQATAKGAPSSVTTLGQRVSTALMKVLNASRPEKASPWLPVYLMAVPALRPWVARLAEVLPGPGLWSLCSGTYELEQVALDLIKQQREADARNSTSTAATAAATSTTAGVKVPTLQVPQPGSFLQQMLSARARGKGSNGAGNGISKGSTREAPMDEEAAAAALTDAQIAANVVTFLAAGFETSANAIAFTLHHLSQPSSAGVLARVLQEVDGLGPPGTVPTHQQLLSGLPWVEACLMETLRLTPPAPYVFRQLQEPMALAGCPGVTLPKGSLMQVSICAVHRNPECWPRPDEYLPERWLPASSSTSAPAAPSSAAAGESEAGVGGELGMRLPGSFIAFGGGARTCVGMKFAIIEAMLTLVLLLQRFTFEVEPGFKLRTVTGVTMAPESGISMRVVPRHRAA